MKAIGFNESRGKLVLGRTTISNLNQWVAIITKYLNDKVIVIESH